MKEYKEEQTSKLEASHSEGIRNLDLKEKKEVKAVGGDLKKSGVSDLSTVGNEALERPPTSTPAIRGPQTGTER